jgi:hypothetical protein
MNSTLGGVDVQNIPKEGEQLSNFVGKLGVHFRQLKHGRCGKG